MTKRNNNNLYICVLFMMKYLFNILLNFLLLFVFTAASYTSAWACDKSKSKKEIKLQTAKCQKSCCKKHQAVTHSNCQSSCCKKNTSHAQEQKKGCCGDDDCSCSISITILGDLPKSLVFNIPNITSVFNVKNTFFYKQSFHSSSFNDIWQPPISNLSI